MSRPSPRAEVRHQFVDLVRREGGVIELDRAALLIAAEEYPELELEAYVGRLDAIAERVVTRLHPEAGPHEILGRMNRVLFEEDGFHGNIDDYYDPRNSYLNEVLDRRTGIPITISTIYLEVARRIGFRLEGVGFPGHFLVKHRTDDGEIVVDPFHRGKVLGPDDLRELLGRVFGGELGYDSRFLRATSARRLLFRLLSNLKAIYLGRGDRDRALAAVERMLLLSPAASRERRDKGILLAELDRPLEALRDLLRYRTLAPEADDATEVDHWIERLRLRVGMLN